MSGMYQQLENFSSTAKFGLLAGPHLQQESTKHPIQANKTFINNCMAMLQTLAMHYSLTEIAKQCRLSVSSIRNLINNTVHNPRTITFGKVLRFYCYAFYVAVDPQINR